MRTQTRVISKLTKRQRQAFGLFAAAMLYTFHPCERKKDVLEFLTKWATELRTSIDVVRQEEVKACWPGVERTQEEKQLQSPGPRGMG